MKKIEEEIHGESGESSVVKSMKANTNDCKAGLKGKQILLVTYTYYLTKAQLLIISDQNSII